ncbi:GNAT family N-acetyltransferase [Bradyrhizobium embrapense]|uniref:GNAT family N-acetyltransferase n=1 Tax=Bradyrhizobium embrapense TaxID=630921 RepID=UPI000A019108|nr:GNAT family N-acetyltransferase [Bradyrhizobium embrapense]
MSYQVRPLRTDDLPSVTRIYNAACHARETTEGTRPWSDQRMKEFLLDAGPSFESYTCEDGGTVVGWTAITRLRLREDVKHAAEMSLYVQESVRRRGIGSALANTLLSRASIIDLHCIVGFVFADLPEVVSFSERRCGFSIAGCLSELFSDGEKHRDILLLEKLVEPRKHSRPSRSSIP